MATESPATRATLHALIDTLPDDELTEASRLLAALHEPNPALRASLLAPLDDEPFTDEERKAVEAAEAAYARGEGVDGEDVRREIGW
jgi:hypothetical protein